MGPTLSFKMLSSFNLIRQLLLRDFMHDPGLQQLGRTPFKTMLILSQFGSSPMGHLCDRLGLERGSFTTVVDTLIGKGLIERRRNPDDRRQILLELTAEGERLVGHESGRLDRHLEKKLAPLTEQERERFIACIDDLFDLSEIMRRTIQ